VKKQITSAFSLIELTLAIGIAALFLLAVIGLMPVAVLVNRNATSQTAATNVMAAVVADLRATPKGNNTSAQFAITFGTAQTLYFDDTGQFSTSLGTNSRYQVTVRWFPSGSVPLRYADVTVTWPAAATAANATGKTEMFAAFDGN
jgi:uncharacterized protein (TIGR02598 family)